MKSVLVIGAFFLSLSAIAQNEVYGGIKYGYLNIENFSSRRYGGVEIDIEFNSNIGIQYSLLAGKNYFHMPAGPSIGFLFGILTAFIPESISYTVPLGENFGLCPYISPFQLDCLKNSKTENAFWAAGIGFGTRAHFYFINRRIRVSPYIEYKLHYQAGLPQGYTYGLNIAGRISD